MTRATGYAYSAGEYDEDTAALAVPVLLGDRPVATLTLCGTGVIPHGRHLELVDLLRSEAIELDKRLAPRTRQRTTKGD